MKFSTALDVDVVAHESADEVSVLIELEAPDAPVVDRARSALQIVLDRSGSMNGAPLDGAKKALADVIARLDPQDVFGVVTFDDHAEVAVPAAPLADKQQATQLVDAIFAGGMTDLSSGYLRGLQELRRAAKASKIRGGTVLVVSDGHVNSGICEVDEFASLTSKAASDGIITSTLGYGAGYDETLLSAIARSGNGNHMFAENPDAAGSAISGEVEGLLSKAVQAVTLTVRFVPEVQLSLYNDLPAHQVADGEVSIELGDLYGSEARKLLLKLAVDGMSGLGVAQIAELELRYVESATLTEHTVTLPVTVNVVPGDEATGRVPDPVVQSEKLYQEGQAAKLRASRAYESGDLDAGASYLLDSQQLLGSAMDIAPAPIRSAMRVEMDEIGDVMSAAGAAGAGYASKMTRDSYHRNNRKRGRE
ncbi:vWA domain-containing protein [Gordonia sputi]|uniref:VWFA domain-containing protein n=1 Tax=Gordonia sputi NBRC 100414 TaxID=1089453 RepID=H5U1C6_9ACTN|nr:VWA domain-containing protein [Gordonia sputi]NKY95740.1 VWA domain-containing protein [Gordonia sputi]GAB39534.1 hypothetical protein GOSPT_070_00220 [Gordonia sputi NBRC 100414]